MKYETLTPPENAMSDPPSRIRFACPACKAMMNAPADAAGAEIECPKCSAPFCIPILAPSERPSEASRPALPKPPPPQPIERPADIQRRATQEAQRQEQYSCTTEERKAGITPPAHSDQLSLGEKKPMDPEWERIINLARKVVAEHGQKLNRMPQRPADSQQSNPASNALNKREPTEATNMDFNCPGCGRILQAPTSMAGMHAPPCPQCNTAIIIPTAHEAWLALARRLIAEDGVPLHRIAEHPATTNNPTPETLQVTNMAMPRNDNQSGKPTPEMFGLTATRIHELEQLESQWKVKRDKFSEEIAGALFLGTVFVLISMIEDADYRMTALGCGVCFWLVAGISRSLYRWAYSPIRQYPNEYKAIGLLRDAEIKHQEQVIRTRVALWDAEDEKKEREIRTHSEFWKSVSPRGFEENIAKLFKNEGHKVALTPASRDGGIDLILEPGQAESVFVQCKQHKGPVGVAVARELFGVMTEKSVRHGMIVSISGFTSGVVDFVKGKSIQLLDLPEIVQRSRQTGTPTKTPRTQEQQKNREEYLAALRAIPAGTSASLPRTISIPAVESKSSMEATPPQSEGDRRMTPEQASEMRRLALKVVRERHNKAKVSASPSEASYTVQPEGLPMPLSSINMDGQAASYPLQGEG